MVPTLWESLHCPGYSVPDDISESQQECLRFLFYKHEDRQGTTGEEVVHMPDTTAEETESQQTAGNGFWVTQSVA